MPTQGNYTASRHNSIKKRATERKSYAIAYDAIIGTEVTILSPLHR